MDAISPATPADAAYSLYNRPVRRVTGGDLHRPGVTCPVCGHAGAEATFEVGRLASTVVVCRDCGTGFLDPPLTRSEIAAQYPPTYYGSTGRKFTRLVEWGVRLVGRRHVEFLARQTPAGGRILDVGCGRGILLKHLADRGFEAHGFEVSQAAAEGVDPRIHLRIASDLAAAGYPENYFDQIIIWHVFEHVSDPRGCLEEMRRIVKPGGEVVVAVPNFSSPQARLTGPAWFHLDLPRHLFHFPIEALKQLLESTGFEVVSEHHFSLRQNPFGWVQSVLNRFPGLPRNGLYELLHNHRQRSQFPLAVKLVLWMAFVAGMPLGLAIEVVAAALKRGATVHVVARRVK